MKILKRSDFRGWTWQIGQWTVEFVTVRHILRTIAIGNNYNRHLVKRWEW